ncbi:ABC transporter permease [Bhargavaea ullalensis]|uniref:ABC-2 type transport system permease protein n=1 Tax=Bhargavaea ullalensis TaxID=1265685 RepID=A0ABV2GE39_9BACL
MGSLRDVWRSRFTRYMEELQRYMKFVFTGHLAIVLVFLIGAGGFAYSNWLKEVPADFPAAPLAGILLGLILAYAPPVTLLKEADAVFFLPMERQLGGYMQGALKWTVASGLFLPVAVFVVSIPLLNTVYGLKGLALLAIVIGVAALHLWNVRTEFAHRWADQGEGVWSDRIIRFILSAAPITAALWGKWWLGVLLLVPAGVYGMLKQRSMKGVPFPFLHFIELENGRMTRFYRFANQFTDVPHLRGAVRRRGWLDWVYARIPFSRKGAPRYLAARTFIRSDDLFNLWVRLTVLSVLGAAFIPIPVASGIFSAALAFACAYQLRDALAGSPEFRMDRLYPLPAGAKAAAARGTVRRAQAVQAVLVIAAASFQFGFGFVPILLGLTVYAVSEVTLQFTGK